MRISRFDIVIVELPIRPSIANEPVGAITTRNLLVAAHDEYGNTGWGESRAHPHVTGETIQGARDELQKNILPGLVGRQLDSLYDVVAVVNGMIETLSGTQQAAFCALGHHASLLWLDDQSFFCMLAM